jgi:fluoroacetyl-CoA thioesterase
MIAQNIQWNSGVLKTGISKTVQKTITEAHTLAFGRGALTELLATPSLTALMIEAAISAVDPVLPEGYVTVGKSTAVSYQHPTIIGMTVTVVASIAEIDTNRIVFEITAFDELGQIARGKHERIIVDAVTFMQKAHRRCDPVKNIIK